MDRRKLVALLLTLAALFGGGVRNAGSPPVKSMVNVSKAEQWVLPSNGALPSVAVADAHAAVPLLGEVWGFSSHPFTWDIPSNPASGAQSLERNRPALGLRAERERGPPSTSA